MATASSALSRAKKFLFGPPALEKTKVSNRGLSFLYYEDPALGHSKCIPHTHIDVHSLPRSPFDMIEPHALLDLAMPNIHTAQKSTSFSREAFANEAWPIYKLAAHSFNSLPASEDSHHSYPCGLFIHSCEVAYQAVRLSKSMNFTTSVSTDHVSDRRAWTLMVITAALFHDYTKLITDMDIVHPHAQKLFLRLSSQHASANSDGTLPSDALAPLSLHTADAETLKSQYSEYIFKPLSQFLLSWLRCFSKSQQKYFVNYRPGRGNMHDLRSDLRGQVYQRVLEKTGLNRLNPIYLDSLLDPDSASYKLIHYDIIDKADKTSAIKTRRTDQIPSAMLCDLIKQSVSLGLVKPGPDFPYLIDGERILMGYPNDLLKLNAEISGLQGYSALAIKPGTIPKTKCDKLLTLMATAGIIECDADGKPLHGYGPRNLVTTFTAAFSKELINLAPRFLDDSSDDTPPEVGDAPRTPASSQEHDLTETAMEPFENGTMSIFDKPPDLGPRQQSRSTSEPTLSDDISDHSIRSFLEHVSVDVSNKAPAAIGLDHWTNLHASERAKHRLFFVLGKALYITRSYIADYCSAIGLDEKAFLKHLHFSTDIVAGTHQVESDRLAVFSLTKSASFAVLKSTLANFYSTLPSKSTSPNASLRPQFSPWVVELFRYQNECKTNMKLELGPFSQTDPDAIVFSKNLITSYLDANDKRARHLYKLKINTIRSRLKDEPLEFSIDDDRIVVPGTISDYLSQPHAH